VASVGCANLRIEYDLGDVVVASYERVGGGGSKLNDSFTLTITKISIHFHK
jgi:hypothetical protein